MRKLASKLGKPNLADINKLVSRRAAKLGVSSEAALVLLAKENGIGAAIYQRRLDPSKQAEVREALPFAMVQDRKTGDGKSASRPALSRRPTSLSKRAALKATIEFLIQDSELRSRCTDILLALGNFDRPINQATQVLEERIRTKSQPSKKMVGENLVNFAFNEDLTRSVLVVASNDPEDQRGFTQMLRGVVPSFRNRTHHHLTNSFSREDALRVCGFIDVLLRVVDATTKR
jgi:uncharacterized protein (TIGR02391 family)